MPKSVWLSKLSYEHPANPGCFFGCRRGAFFVSSRPSEASGEIWKERFSNIIDLSTPAAPSLEMTNPFARHSEPARTLAWESASLGGQAGKVHHQRTFAARGRTDCHVASLLAMTRDGLCLQSQKHPPGCFFSHSVFQLLAKRMPASCSVSAGCCASSVTSPSKAGVFWIVTCT